MKPFLLSVAFGLLALAPSLPLRADGIPDALARFSVFDSVQSIDADTVLGTTGTDFNFNKGLGVQTCYWLPFPPKEAATYVRDWNPSGHPELEIFVHKKTVPPFGAAGQEDHYLSLTLDPKVSAQKKFFDQSRNAVAAADSGDLNLSKAEAEALAKDPDPAHGWRQILSARALDLFTTRPYETAGGKTISPSLELRGILTDDPKVRQELAPVLRATGLFGNGGKGNAESLASNWEFLVADHHAIVTLGATVVIPAPTPSQPDRWQLCEADYYSSGEYDVSATLCEFWPYTVGGKAGSLVWEDDLLAASSVSESKGIEKMAFAALFLKEVKASIAFMKADAAAGK